jgi:2-polyprenyl-3-methyl-5-hydroxy-6-metoxy-1,4-benzoquinol methylase
MRLFDLGRVGVTSSADAALRAAGVDPEALLSRHQSGDWGEVDETDRQDNAFGVEHGAAILSRYRLSDAVEVAVVTIADRTATRLLLAEEFEQRDVGVGEGYARWARFYDREKNPLIAVEAPHVARLLGRLAFREALDVGTGTGRYALALARQGARVVAVDQSAEMLAVARQAARQADLPITFVRALLEDGLPVRDGAFDLVICALMLSHLADLPSAMRAFHRALRPGGHLLISAFHPDSIQGGWRTSLINAEPGVIFCLPNTAHDRADYTAALAGAGLCLLDVIDAPLGEVPPGYLSDRLVRQYRDRAFCLIMLARK